MAKKKNKSRKQGVVSKVANGLLILLSFARPISILVAPGNINSKVEKIIWEATFGLVRGDKTGPFDLAAGLPFYAPAGAAALLGMIKKHVMKAYPIRR